MIEVIEKLKNLVFRKKDPQPFYGNYIQVELTQEAKESNVNDDFNKQIVIYRNGRRVRVVDFSPEDLSAIKTVHPELPVYVEKLDDDYDMMEEEYFGEVHSR